MTATKARSRTLSADEWIAEGERLYGTDRMQWKFVCPVCGHVATAQDWKDAGAPEGAIAFSCVGRWRGAKRDAFCGRGPGPCNYAGGGLFRLNPVNVEGRTLFEFAAHGAAWGTK